MPGPAGEDGLGIKGDPGQQGERGPQGDRGPQGERGLPGELGRPGERGERGERGEPGPIGPQGERGLPGELGRPGERGERGERGEPGPIGPQGQRGLQGLAGPSGERGPQGDRGEPGIAGLQGERGLPGEAGTPGRDGAPGLLPIVKQYALDEVYYRGDVVTHLGSTWQCNADTGRAPPHSSWTPLAVCGVDGRTPQIHGTWQSNQRYLALDIVALDGGAFMARCDDPGDCPGPDWQLICKQGRQGKPGDRGPAGPQGERGRDGLDAPLISGWVIDRAEFTAAPEFVDGSRGAPLNLRALFEQYHEERNG